MSVAVQSLPESKSPMSWLAELYRRLFQLVFRMCPYPTKPRLIRIGQPDRNAPVLVTGNYDLTVRRVCCALRGTDCYLLVTRSGGIDVWCAATGGLFNVDGILSILKTSGIGELVDHRRLQLPMLAAASIDLGELHRRTGWMGVFGPLWAEDIPEYLKTRRKREERLRVTFTIPERLEVATAMWGSLSLRYTWMFMLVFGWRIAPWFMAALAALAFGVTLGCFILPGKTFVQKGSVLGLVGVAGLTAWMIATGSTTVLLAVQGVVILGFCSFLIGVSFPSYSPYWTCNYSDFFYGSCHQDLAVGEQDCIGCGICNWICPFPCFAPEGEKMRLVQPASCVGCGACSLQCPTDTIRAAGVCA